ncbi:hypothetical protein [Pseudoclavibacter helvolus]|uniref:hypothetical protein n=1 Tax=Pseudoclavibacter helvolus TaxID=255205 RepID=UPI003C72DF87
MTSKQTPAPEAPARRFRPVTIRVQVEGIVDDGGLPIPVEPIVFSVAAREFTQEWFEQMPTRYAQIQAQLDAQED